MPLSLMPNRQDLLNISPIVTDAAAAVVDDSFLRCFQVAPE